MVINDIKTKFMIINGSDEDRKMSMKGLIIDHCDVYVYLGAVFTSDGSTKSAIEENYKMKSNKLRHAFQCETQNGWCMF